MLLTKTGMGMIVRSLGRATAVFAGQAFDDLSSRSSRILQDRGSYIRCSGFQALESAAMQHSFFLKYLKMHIKFNVLGGA